MGQDGWVTDVELTTSSELRAPIEQVWARVASARGINHELGPWMRMTAPRGTDLSAADVPIGRPWFRSWVLLAGVLPFDYDELCIEWLEPGRGFLERSRMLSASLWEHERTLERLAGGGTRVTDRVAFKPRMRAARRLHGAVIAATFRHRHRRLRAFFGPA
jgi:ligand-binding SRPBCC domain-containing protein